MSAPAKIKQNEIVGMGSDKDGNVVIDLSSGVKITIEPDGLVKLSSKFKSKYPDVRRTYLRKLEVRFR